MVNVRITEVQSGVQTRVLKASEWEFVGFRRPFRCRPGLLFEVQRAGPARFEFLV